MTRFESNTGTNTPHWSAHSLPKPKTSLMQRFSVLAVAVGLVVIVLASTVHRPIQTGGTQMEPTRFTVSPQQASTSGIMIAAGRN